MPFIQDINATNSSFVLQYGNYTDFNTWVFILGLAIVLLLISRYLPTRDEIGKFLIAVLAFIFSVAAIWGSLGVAHFDYTHGATLLSNNSTVNQSITYDYIYPVQQVVATPWLTIFCIVITVFTFLNALDLFLIMMQTPAVDEKKKGGRGIRI